MSTTRADVRSASRNAERWLLACGIVFALETLAVLLYFGVTVASKWPPLDAPAAMRAAHYVEHWEQIRLANFLLPLPTPLFLLFLGGLASVLWRAEGGSAALSITALVAGVATAMVWPIGILVGALAMQIGRDGGDLVTMQVLEGIGPLSLALSALPRAVLLGAASVVVLHAGCAPRWIGWLGLALVPLTLTGTVTLLIPAVLPLLMLGMPLFVLWVLAVSVGTLRLASDAAHPGRSPEWRRLASHDGSPDPCRGDSFFYIPGRDGQRSRRPGGALSGADHQADTAPF